MQRSIQKCLHVACALAFVAVLPAYADGGQTLPRHDEKNGKIRGHHVRLEGYINQKSILEGMLAQQKICLQMQGIHVNLPPDGEILHRYVKDIYYTENLRVEYTRNSRIYSIDEDCKLQKLENKEKIFGSVHYAGIGICNFHMDPKKGNFAEGNCREFYPKKYIDHPNGKNSYFMPKLPSEIFPEGAESKTSECTKLVFDRYHPRWNQGDWICLIPRKEKWPTLHQTASGIFGILVEDIAKDHKDGDGRHYKASLVEQDIYLDKKILFPHLYGPGFQIELDPAIDEDDDDDDDDD